MGLRRFKIAPLSVALYHAPFPLEELSQLRDRCVTDLRGLVAELTVLSTTPGVGVITGRPDTARLDACITTAATVVSAISRANRMAIVQAQTGS